MNLQEIPLWKTGGCSAKTCAFLVCATILIPWLLPFRLNLSASLPVGVYRIGKGDIQPGVLISFCLSKDLAVYAKERGYINFGFSCPGWTQALVKPVCAVAGDRVVVADAGVVVRGEFVANTKVLALDSKDRWHGHWIMPGEYTVPAGAVFVLSNCHERSWDSRYFGFVPLRHVGGIMEPVWTW